MFFHILHQVLESDIIMDKTNVYGIIDFQFFGNTGTDKSKFIRDSHFFPGINGSAHQRALYREKLRQQLRMVFFDISHHSGTGLRDAALEAVLFNIINVTPGSNICTERNIDKTFYTKFFQTAQNPAVFFRIIGFKCRRYENGNAFALQQVFKECIGIVAPGTGLVVAGIKTGAADDTAFRIHIDAGDAAFVWLCRNTGADTAADLNTLIAAYTVFIGVH